jgi:hypothetical protein
MSLPTGGQAQLEMANFFMDENLIIERLANG